MRHTFFARGRSPVALFLLLGILATTQAGAATLRVETWGEDAENCGSRAAPCETIGYAIGARASRNDRIIVGPGEYRDNLAINFNLSGPLDGLKLESTAGRWGTMIRGDTDGQPTIRIGRPRVQIGRKGRGFTIAGPLSSYVSTAGVATLGDGVERLRIEGNWFVDHEAGIALDSFNGGKHRIAHNLFTDLYYGVYLAQAEKTVIHDNRFEIDVEVDSDDTAPDIAIELREGSDFTSVFRNRIIGGATSNGIRSDNDTEYLRIRDNVVSGHTSFGYELGDIVGTRVEYNIASGVAGDGFYLDQDGFAVDPKVTGNLALGSGHNGFMVVETNDLALTGNTALQNADYGIRLASSVVASAKRNATYHNDLAGPGCGLLEIASTITYQQHYFGGASGPDAMVPDGDGHDTACGTFGAGSTFASKPAPVSLKRARQL